MTLCQLSASDVQLNASQELILTWKGTGSNSHHTKPEYIKILQDAKYEVSYEIKWNSLKPTTQPLQVTMYRVMKDYTLHALQTNVTVCVGNPITLRKKLQVDLKADERVCIGAKNLSTSPFILMNCNFSLAQI